MGQISTIEAIKQASEASKEYTDKQIEDVKKHYDVVTNSISGDGSGWAKLTIADDWTDRIQHPYRLIVEYYEDDTVYTAYESTFYSPRSDGTCRVECSMYATAPRYFVDNDVYLTMVSGSNYRVYVKCLDGVCTGATLEWVDSLPDGVHDVSQDTRWINQSYISYTVNSTTSQRPIGHDAKPYSIVCRNSTAGINVRTPGPGKTYADAEAVSYGYLRDVMLPEALPTAGGGGKLYLHRIHAHHKFLGDRFIVNTFYSSNGTKITSMSDIPEYATEINLPNHIQISSMNVNCRPIKMEIRNEGIYIGGYDLDGAFVADTLPYSDEDWYWYDVVTEV